MNEFANKLKDNKAGLWEEFEVKELTGLKLMDVTGNTLLVLFKVKTGNVWSEYTKEELDELFKKEQDGANQSKGKKTE